MSVVPSWYCAPESIRKSSPGSSVRLVALRDAVMHDGAVRAGAGDGREARRPSAAPVSRRKASSVSTASISVSLPLRRLAREPGEEARHRGAVAAMRGAGAGDLGRVLHRLHAARSGRARHRPCRRRSRCGATSATAPSPGRGAPCAFAAPSASSARRQRRPAGATSATAPSARAGLVRELAPVDEQRRRGPRAGISAKPSGSGVCAHVAAADVEGPGDDCAGRETTSASSFASASCSRMRASFASRVSPASSIGCGRTGASGGGGRSGQIASTGCISTGDERRRRPARPPSRSVFSAVGGVQPGVVAERRRRRQVLADPRLRRLVGELHRRRTTAVSTCSRACSV